MGCRQALQHGHSLSSRISLQAVKNLAICQHSNNADRICLGNRNGAAREHFTGKPSNPLLTFSELPSERGRPMLLPKVQAQRCPHRTGGQCPLGLQLPPSMRTAKAGKPRDRSVLSWQGLIPQLAKGRSREKIAFSGNDGRLRDCARAPQQFTARVNTWRFLSSRLKEVFSHWWSSSPRLRGDRRLQSTQPFLPTSSDPWHSDGRGY